MLEQKSEMKKTLKEVDPVYENVRNFMSKEEKIKYCESLIKETEEFLNNTVQPIDTKTKEKYITLVDAARDEIESLKKKH